MRRWAMPIAIVAVAVGVAAGLASLKEPPEEKITEVTVPEVEIETRQAGPVSITVGSYGVVQPREKTELVAQVSGNVAYIHPAFVRGGQIAADTVLMRIDDSDYQTALLDAEANYATALAALETEQAQGKVAREQLSDVKNPTVLALRKPQLAQAKAAVKATLAMVQRAQRDLERTAIRAPFDALVVARHPGLGSYVSTGTALGTVFALATAEIRLPVAAKQWPQLVNQGNDAEVTLRVQQGEQSLEWPAKIVRSEGIVDDNSRMHYLVAQVENPYQQTPPLRFGQYVTADIQGRVYQNSVRIPYQWLREQRLPVFKDGQLAFENVDVLRLEGDQAVVQLSNTAPMAIVTTALQYPSEGMALHRVDDISVPAGESEIMIATESKDES
ncbi:efflux RND transporter periplasmic adaptor subunit [Bacterioplanes sanyensis]|nr:efflux RND transporter periplasmic adaptor subunit [Bacterioplanes sanyensis]